MYAHGLLGLGLVLLILGLIFGSGVLITLGVICLVAGVVVWLVAGIHAGGRSRP